jgi:hypothetical protein
MWVEAAGMVPQVERVVREFGIPVYSGDGFQGLPSKYETAQRVLKRSEIENRPTLVLQVGDHDPSGQSILDSFSEDVVAFAFGIREGDAPWKRLHDEVTEDDVMDIVEFQRVVVTPPQIASYALPEAPPKPTDKRGDWQGGTVQAEALSPDQLAAEIRLAVETVIVEDFLDGVKEQEEADRRDILARLRRIEDEPRRARRSRRRR